MIDKGKKNLLGIYIDAVDYETVVTKIIRAAQEQRSLAVSALAVHGVMTGILDPIHAARLNTLDLVVPDGQPVRWALNLLHGTNLPDRVYGPTLMLKVCAQAAMEGLPIYLYGSTSDILLRLADNLRNQFPRLQIAGLQPSRFRQITLTEKEEIIQTIATSGARILFVGLGCPRQEVWVYEHRGLLPMPMLAVGAAFAFHAGVVAQAPPQLQKMGLEWFYRLVREPKRLWRRYLKLNPLYLWLVGLQLMGLRRFHPTEITPPDQNALRYG